MHHESNTHDKARLQLQTVMPEGGFQPIWEHAEPAGETLRTAVTADNDDLLKWEAQFTKMAKAGGRTAILQAALASPPAGLSASLTWLHLVGTAFLKVFSVYPEASLARGSTQVPFPEDTADILLAEAPWRCCP